jgi:hypothetical protein
VNNNDSNRPGKPRATPKSPFYAGFSHRLWGSANTPMTTLNTKFLSQSKTILFPLSRKLSRPFAVLTYKGDRG